MLERVTRFGGLRGANYDAVVFPHSALFYAGTLGIARLLAGAEGVPASGGVAAFKADILFGTEPSPEHLNFAMLGGDGLAAQIESATGFVVVGGEPRLSPRMAATLGSANSSPAAADDLVREHRGRLAIPSVWFLRKNRETTKAGWQCIDRWLVAPLLDEQLDRRELGPAGRRDGRRIVAGGGSTGNVFFGPYLALPEGRYEAIFGIEPAGARRCSLLLDVAAGYNAEPSKPEARRSRRNAGDAAVYGIGAAERSRRKDRDPRLAQSRRGCILGLPAARGLTAISRLS